MNQDSRHGRASDAFKRLKILPGDHMSLLDLLGHQAGKVGLEPDLGFGNQSQEQVS